jgi:nicotinamidase-related amidase
MDLHLDPATTALILIDVQNGTLAMPLAPYDRAGLVAAAARLGGLFAAASAPIAVVRIAFSEDGRDRLSQPVDRPMALPPGGLPAGWSELAPEIAALPAAISITKRQWSAFHGTELDLQLRRRGLRQVVIGGIATNFGVESTARDAWQLGYAVVVAEDACTSLGAPLHEFAVTTTLPRVALVRKIADIAAALGRAPDPLTAESMAEAAAAAIY